MERGWLLFNGWRRFPRRPNVSRSPLNGFAAALSAQIGARSLKP
jgi:hypothetical protein